MLKVFCTLYGESGGREVSSDSWRIAEIGLVISKKELDPCSPATCPASIATHFTGQSWPPSGRLPLIEQWCSSTEKSWRLWYFRILVIQYVGDWPNHEVRQVLTTLIGYHALYNKASSRPCRKLIISSQYINGTNWFRSFLSPLFWDTISHVHRERWGNCLP